MFCTKCGAQVPEGNAFCTACGNKVGAVPAQQPIQRPVQQPVQQPVRQPVQPAQQPAQPKPAFKLPQINLPSVAAKDPNGEKKPFVNPFVGNKRLLVRVMTIVCVLLMLLSYVVCVNTSIEKIPIVSLILGGAKDEMREMKAEIVDAAEEMEELLDEGDEIVEDLSNSEIKEFKKFVKAIKKCGKSFSLNNISNLVSFYEKLEDSDLADLVPGIDDVVREAEALQAGLNVIKVFFLFGALFCALFLALGGFLNVPGLAIAGTVLAAIFSLVFCSLLMVPVNLVADIYMVMQASEVKKAQKAAAQVSAEATA